MIETERLCIRPVVEADRETFVRLFGDASYMLFSGGVLDACAANERFDAMLAMSRELSFAKRPVVVRETGQVIGYAGVNRFLFEGRERLEFGWRLTESSRGQGFATEAVRAILDHAGQVWSGEIIAMIDPTNAPSANVARKVGFMYWKAAEVGGYIDDIFRIRVGPG